MKEISTLRQIVDYIKRNITKGYTTESLKWALINQGYSRIQISRAIEIANKEIAEQIPKFEEKPAIKYEIIDEDDKPIEIKKSLWKRFFG